jgi:hypothetical protein
VLLAVDYDEAEILRLIATIGGDSKSGHGRGPP